MPEPRPAILRTSCPDVALTIRPTADPVEEIREEVRAWAAIHAHYFGPDVIDRAARLITDNGVPVSSTYLVTRDTLLAYLHFAARA
jgi:N-acetyl-anhydromuramyl-L-alanine amidase AmpD